MRIRFAGYMVIAVVSAFLIVASYAFVADTFWWLALIGGVAIALVGVAEVAIARRPTALTAPAALAALLGVAMAVIAAAASVSTTADWAFGLAIATGGLAAFGLTEHELVAERDVRHPGTPATP